MGHWTQAADTEVWVYRNKDKREAVFAFRGTSSPQDMMTDSAFTLAAYCPGDRPPSRSPEEVAAEIADEDVKEGPMKKIFSAVDVSASARTPPPLCPFCSCRSPTSRVICR